MISYKITHQDHLISQLTAGFKAHLKAVEQGGDNCGQWVEAFLAHVGLPKGKPWCAAFVAFVGYWVFYDFTAKRSYWPLKRTGGCQELHDATPAPCRYTTPQGGDIFLIWFEHIAGGPRFAHTGLVFDVHPDGSCTTIEGNTNEDGSRNGWKVAMKTRRFGPKDRFLRWTEIPIS